MHLVVRGRLWRRADPSLDEGERTRLVAELMKGRRAVKAALANDADPKSARAQVDDAKRALGVRGPVWWSDGAPDLNRHMAATTLYADWFASAADEQK